MTFDMRRAAELGLTKPETAVLRRLSSPAKIQDFLTVLPSNPEPDGATCYSARGVLRHRVAHCIEAAFLAACALMLHGRPALLLDLEASEDDDDHVVALFKEGRHWGAISKTNHIWLRWRDPVYRSTRELAMSYFHEYVKGPAKTLRKVSRPIDVAKWDPALWVTHEGDCWEAEQRLFDVVHVPLISAAQAKLLRKRERFEVETGRLKEFAPSKKRYALIKPPK